MKLDLRIALVVGALALAAAPAMALGQSGTAPGNVQGQGNGPQYTPARTTAPETPGPGAGLPEKAKAYGVYCQGQSKKHVAGQKGTPFSQCVTAMAKASHDESLSSGQSLQGDEQEARQRREGNTLLTLRQSSGKAEKKPAKLRPLHPRPRRQGGRRRGWAGPHCFAALRRGSPRSS